MTPQYSNHFSCDIFQKTKKAHLQKSEVKQSDKLDYSNAMDPIMLPLERKSLCKFVSIEPAG